MAEWPVPTMNFMSNAFVISAGCLLFRFSSSNVLQLCIIYHTRWNKWLLPKGRKDCGEHIDIAAIRETFEETGYACELLPCNLHTRAPPPGVNLHPEEVIIADRATEPFAITMQELDNNGMKFIWWFIARVRDSAAEKVSGTQTSTEAYESHFLPIEEAIQRLTFRGDREIATKAWQIVQNTADDFKMGMEGLFLPS